MSERLSFGRLTAGKGGGRGNGPFRILLMGDFSGRANRGTFEPDLASRRPEFLDVDNFEQVLAGLTAELRLPVGEEATATISVRLRELDDLHPDRLFESLEVFQVLRDLRSRLSDPATFDAAAAEVHSWAAKPGEPAERPVAAAAAGEAEGEAAPRESQEELLGRLLGDRPVQAGAPAPASGGIDSLIREIVAPHIVPDRDREQADLISRVDEAIAAQMRAVLHHPDFRAVEAAWRSVHFLVTNLETDEELKLFLVDVTKDEFAADLTAAEDLGSTGLYKLLVEQTVGTPGGRPWGAVAGAYWFDRTEADAMLLGRMAKIARAAGAPFVAAARDRVVGCESLAATPDPRDWTLAASEEAAAAWDQLRKLPEATYVGLAAPRFLLRLPYGKDTDPVERFELEELAGSGPHECYLWGNPAFAVVQVLGADFAERGWDLGPELYRDIEGLPMHVYTADGERHVKPCAEVYLTDRAGERIQELGVTALLSVQGRDVVRVRGVASIADPVTALAGRWSR